MIDFDQVRADAIGKWDGIYERLGIDVGDGRHKGCPACGGTDRFRYDNKHNNGDYFCNQCNAGDGISLVMKVLNIDFETCMNEIAGIVGTVEASPCHKEKPVSPTTLRKIFTESTKIISNDLVSLYLQSRGLDSLPVTLRYSQKCYESETKQDQHAMLAIFSDSKGKAVTIHRTYLTPGGQKLSIESPKKIMPPLKPMPGGAARLYEHKGGILGVCEGIETAIAIHAEAEIPVWAALSANLLEKFEPPKNIKEIIVFGDNDKNFTGQKAAYSLANRLSMKGVSVRVEIPEDRGADFCDVWANN